MNIYVQGTGTRQDRLWPEVVCKVSQTSCRILKPHKKEKNRL